MKANKRGNDKNIEAVIQFCEYSKLTTPSSGIISSRSSSDHHKFL